VVISAEVGMSQGIRSVDVCTLPFLSQKIFSAFRVEALDYDRPPEPQITEKPKTGQTSLFGWETPDERPPDQ
jgi:hypothetical protein